MSRKKSRKKSVSAFAIFLVTYSVLLCLLIGIGLKWVWGLLIDYEAGLAETTADRIVTDFSAENISKMIDIAEVSVSEFENKNTLAAYYKDMLMDKTITYRRKGGEYTANHPVYYVMADDKPYAEFSLKQTGENPHGFPVWELEKVVFSEDVVEDKEIKIKVPARAEVYLNGILAERDRYISSEEEIVLAKNIAEYVKTVPAYDYYVFEGLIGEPRVELANCEAMDGVETDGILFYDYASAEELIQENDELLRRISKNYGGYLVNRVSFGTMSSDLTGIAKERLSDIPAIWAYLYGEEYTYEISDWSAANGRKYGEDCFSCDLEFTLNVNYRVTRNISYETKLSCMFVRENGKWVLADFVMG